MTVLIFARIAGGYPETYVFHSKRRFITWIRKTRSTRALLTHRINRGLFEGTFGGEFLPLYRKVEIPFSASGTTKPEIRDLELTEKKKSNSGMIFFVVEFFWTIKTHQNS